MSDRLGRLLLLVPAVRARPGIPLAELATQLGCDEQELRKDLALLACVGVPPYQPDDLIDIELRDDRVWVTLAQAFTRPTRLSATEAAALTIAVRALAPNDATARSAAEKLTRAVSPQQRELYEGLVHQIAAAPPDTSSDVEGTIRRAIEARREIEIDYYAPTERASRNRTVLPREIVAANGVRYLSARKSDGGERLYRLDRIAHARLLSTTFSSLPAIDLAAETARISRFDTQADLPQATLQFDASVAAAARMRHPEGRALSDGRLEVGLRYSSLPWLVSYAFSWGGHAIVSAPPDARAAFRSAVDRAAEIQGTLQPPSSP
jgi:proteasome accessory factor C